MGISLLEKDIQYILNKGLEDWKRSAYQEIDKVFSKYARSFRQEVKTYLQNHTINIITGWPRMDIKPPFWAVVPATLDEVEHFVSGELIEEIDVSSSVGESWEGSLYSSGIRIMIGDTNGDVVIMMSGLCMYLFRKYDEEITDLGFMERSISAGEFERLLASMPENYYYKSLLVTGKVLDYVEYSGELIPAKLGIVTTT